MNGEATSSDIFFTKVYVGETSPFCLGKAHTFFFFFFTSDENVQCRYRFPKYYLKIATLVCPKTWSSENMKI